MGARFSFLVLLSASLLLAGCAERHDVNVWNKRGGRLPIKRAEFEHRLPRGWQHHVWGFYGRVQREWYEVSATEVYDVWSYPRRILTVHADDALMKIKLRPMKPE
jgi:hypothetical protein